MEYRHLGSAGLQVVENTRALDIAPKLTADLVAQIEEILGNKPEPESDFR